MPAGSKHSYFLYLFRLDPEQLGCTSREFSQALAAEGIPNDAHMITGGRPVYLYDIFQKRSAFPGSEYPFSLTGRVYRPGDCPVAEEAFERWITMYFSERWSETDIDEIAAGIRQSGGILRRAQARGKRSCALDTKTCAGGSAGCCSRPR